MTRVPVALALLGVAGVAAAAPVSSRPDGPRVVLERASAPLSHSNSRDGRAILTATGLQPGDARAGQVTIRNGGGSGHLALTTRSSGDLASRLRLSVRETTGGPARIDELLAAAPACVDLGDLPAGASRTYSFSVLFPPGPGDDAAAGGAARADFEWSEGCVPPPETLLAVGNVSFAVSPGPYRFSPASGTASVGVRCIAAEDDRCRGRLVLERREHGRGRGIAMAVGRIDAHAGRSQMATLRLNARARRWLAGRGVVPVRAYLVARDSRGRVHRASYRDRLVYPRRARSGGRRARAAGQRAR